MERLSEAFSQGPRSIKNMNSFVSKLRLCKGVLNPDSSAYMEMFWLASDSFLNSQYIRTRIDLCRIDANVDVLFAKWLNLKALRQ